MVDDSRVLEYVPSQQQVWLQKGGTDSHKGAGRGHGSMHSVCQSKKNAGSDAKMVLDPELGRV